MDQPTTQTALDSIIQALEIDQLPPEEQEDALLKLNELVFRGSIMRMLAQMDEPTKEAFGKLVEGDAPEEALQAFIEQHVPNADQAVADTVAALTSDILAVTNNQ